MDKPCNKCDLAYVSFTSKGYKVRCDPSYKNCYSGANCDRWKKYKESLAKKRKYKRGERINSFNEFNEYISENEIIYWHDKPYHIGWIGSWQYLMVKRIANSGSFYKAVKNSAESGVDI